jgi:WD40 repeat protein
MRQDAHHRVHVATQVLDAHRDEVWHVAFSHRGTMLASASKDCTAVIWAVRPLPAGLAVLHVLAGHGAPVDFVSWSPDDRMLLTCSERTVRLWNAEAGALMHTFTCVTL